MKLFTEHPNTMGETYGQHFFNAMRFGMQMIIGGVACCLHAIFPFIFEKTGSNYLISMTQDFVDRLTYVDDRVTTLAEHIRQVKEKSK